MAHTILKQIYCEETKKYIECEVLVLDKEENLPETDEREIILHCYDKGNPYSELSDVFSSSGISDNYEETDLIDQYIDYDAREKGE